jgi:2-C-methyl-D-erythritol 2,4-cyclodiphosphate synthase
MKIRIGQGLDVHAFCEGDHVMLGGVRIAHEKALAAHSDGDVVLHALCDAMLGAAAMGDIGRHFSPSDPQWKNADSRELLRQVDLLLKHDGWSVSNADITVVCEQPKVTPHADGPTLLRILVWTWKMSQSRQPPPKAWAFVAGAKESRR